MRSSSHTLGSQCISQAVPESLSSCIKPPTTVSHSLLSILPSTTLRHSIPHHLHDTTHPLLSSASPYATSDPTSSPHHITSHRTTLGPLLGKSVSKAVDAAQLLNLTEKDGKRNALAAVVTAKREVTSLRLCTALQVNFFCCIFKDSY